jgi:hypothetical protein
MALATIAYQPARLTYLYISIEAIKESQVNKWQTDTGSVLTSRLLGSNADAFVQDTSSRTSADSVTAPHSFEPVRVEPTFSTVLQLRGTRIGRMPDLLAQSND